MKRVIVFLPLLLLALFALPAPKVMADCTWTKVFDFTGSDNDFGFNVGAWEDGLGIHSASSGGNNEISIYDNLDFPVLVTQATVTYTVAVSAGLYYDIGLYFDFGEGGEHHIDFVTASGVNTLDTGPTSKNTGAITFYSNSTDSDYYLTDYTLHGEGVNPWGLGSGCGDEPTATYTPSNTPPPTDTPTPTLTPTATPGPTITPTPVSVIHSTIVFGDTAYEVAIHLELTPSDYLMVGFQVVIVGLIMLLVFIIVRRGKS